MARTSYRILIVETDHFLREKISGIVSRRGDVETVTQVSSMGYLAGTAETIRPDIILIDLASAASGLPVLKQINESLPETLIVCMSDYAVSKEELSVPMSRRLVVIGKSDLGRDFDSLIGKLGKKRRGAPSGGRAARPLVLVADDDAFYRRRVKRILESAACETRVFGGGRELLEEIRTGRTGPACAILDVYMEGTDGIEIAETIRRTHKTLPIIFVSSDDTAETAGRALRLGNCSYITKPFTEKDLLGAVSGFVKKMEAPAHAEKNTHC